MDFSGLKTQICEILSASGGFENACVVGAFLAAKREIPLRKPVVAVALAGVELVPAGMGDFLGGDGARYGRFAKVKIGFEIFAPEPDLCQSLFERLCEILFKTDFGIETIVCEAHAYDTKTGAASLRAAASLTAVADGMDSGRERLFPQAILKRT